MEGFWKLAVAPCFPHVQVRFCVLTCSSFGSHFPLSLSCCDDARDHLLHSSKVRNCCLCVNVQITSACPCFGPAFVNHEAAGVCWLFHALCRFACVQFLGIYWLLISAFMLLLVCWIFIGSVFIYGEFNVFALVLIWQLYDASMLLVYEV